MSWMLRLIVGSVSITAVDMLSVVPVLEAVNTGEISAVTCTVSETVASCRVTGTSTASPSLTLTLSSAGPRKPARSMVSR